MAMGSENGKRSRCAVGGPLASQAAAAAEAICPREDNPTLHFICRAGWFDGRLGRDRRAMHDDERLLPELGAAYVRGYDAGVAARDPLGQHVRELAIALARATAEGLR